MKKRNQHPLSLLPLCIIGLIFLSNYPKSTQCQLTSVDVKSYTNPSAEHVAPTITQTHSHIRSTSDSTSTLKLAIITHRHGDRTPLYYPPDELDFVSWPMGYGQLTPLGVNQLYVLGDEIRKNLLTGLLPTKYNSELVYVRSSDTDRTLQSADSFMTGIYPPGMGPTYHFEEPKEDQKPALLQSVQPVPIHTVDPDLDFLLRSYDNCARYEEYLLADVYTSPEALSKQAEYADLLSLLSDSFGFPVTLSNFYPVYDLLKCEHVHQVYNRHSVDEETYERVVELENWIFSQLEFKPNPNSYLIGAELVSQLISDVNDRIMGVNRYRFKEYSAHDVTVAGLLMTLGVEIEEVPPYAAHVITELHEIDDIYYLKFTYNSKQISIPKCQSSLPALCPFSSFQLLFGELATKDIPAECAIKYVSPVKTNTEPVDTATTSESVLDGKSLLMYIIIVVLSGMTIIIVSLSGYFIYRRKRSERMLLFENTINSPAHHETSSTSSPSLPSLPASYEMEDISVEISEK